MDWAACGLLLLYQCNLHVYVCLVQDYVQNLALLITGLNPVWPQLYGMYVMKPVPRLSGVN